MAYPAPPEAVETRRKPDNTKHAIIPEIGPTCQRKPGVVTRRKEKRNQVLGTRNPETEKGGTGKRKLRNPEPREKRTAEHGTWKERRKPERQKAEPGIGNPEPEA
jgi:hypothetical protein